MHSSKEKTLSENRERVKDNVLSRLLITFFLGLLLCCMCFCSVTWAWLTDATSSGAATITSGECSLTAKITKDESQIGEVKAQGTDSILIQDMVTGTYTIKITLPADSASGYLVIKAGEEYYSEALQRSSSEQTQNITLILQSDQDVTFTARWGIYSNAPNSIPNNGDEFVLTLD